MVKRKRSRSLKKVEDIDKDVDDIDPESQDFFFDEVDKFHAQQDESNRFEDSDSDESVEEEVLDLNNVKVSDEEGYDDEDENAADSEEEEDNEIPSSMSWGRKKSSYYGAEDVQGLQGIDRDEVEDDEEEEALKIQQRLAEEIDEDQFQLFQLPETTGGQAESVKSDSEKVAVDVSSLSAKAQWKLLKQESPELKELIADFKDKSSDLQTTIIPLLSLVKSGKINGHGAIYVQTKYNLYMSYLVNISFYMSQKAKLQSLVGHPVIKRLVQYRTLINNLSHVDEKLVEEINELLNPEEEESSSDGEEQEDSTSKTFNNGLEMDGITSDDEKAVPNLITKKPKASVPPPQDPVNYYTTLSERLQLQEVEKKKTEEADHTTVEDVQEDSDRRAITYTMKKNKGAQSKKRKIDRNPRVKHREKYRKAIIRRRRQVREYRPEMEKYSGEATGIRAGIIRAVKIQ